MGLLFCGKRLLLLRKVPFKTLIKRHGYIVLVPEIGEDLPEKNPLLQQNGLPEFSNLTIEHCMATIGRQTLDFENGVRDIEKRIEQNMVNDIFEDVFTPLETLGIPLDITWGVSKTLYLGNSSVMPTKNYLAIHDRARRARSAKFNSLQIYKAAKESVTEINRTEEQTRLCRKFELEGKLNGLDLSTDDKVKLNTYLHKLSEEKAKFKIKTEASTKLFQHKCADPQIVRNFPKDLLKVMAVDPVNYINGPWITTLQPQVYLPFMEYCPERDLRWNTWLAMVGRGSTFNDREYTTSVHLEEIRHLRNLQANLLGYKTFADMSMETKMAGNVENVECLLQTLLEKAKPAQEQELRSMHEFAVQRNFKGSRIELWDLPYWRREQQFMLYNCKEEDFQHYFPLPKVLEGLFTLCENLFQITIKQENNVSTWAKDVHFYYIYEQQSSEPIGGFYLDPYIRTDQKLRFPHNNGWVVGIQNRSQIIGTKPLAALVFNFQPPTTTQPSFLTLKQVNILFRKFGHVLQHLLTQTSYTEVSGLSNIEWDMVEVCGHVLAHWLNSENVINSISSYKNTGEKLPTDMFKALISFKKQTAGIDLCRELYLSALDLELHSSKKFWYDIVKNLWSNYRCFPLDKLDFHPCSFTQIFVEEWGAAYYSHVWACMIAADIYSAFYEVRDDEQQVAIIGKRFRDTFLALGGSCNSNEVFRKFRGRDPSPKALLSSLGLKQIQSAN